MKKILIILAIFGIDRLTKIYLINLQTAGTEIDFYIFSFLNFYLVWNTGIGFGFIPLEANIYYDILSIIIAFITLILIFLLFKAKDISAYFLAITVFYKIQNKI